MSVERGRSTWSSIGHSPPENDPSEPMRVELSELQDMMKTIETCGRTMQAAMEMLNAAPRAMLEKMQRYYPPDGPNGQLVLRFSGVQGQLAQRLESSKAHMTVLQTLLTRMYEQHTAAIQAFSQRDEAHTTSAHYERKVESLRSQLVRSPGNHRLVEKLSRNEQKRFDFAAAFQQITDEIEKSTSAILVRKFQDTGEAIGHICRFYADAFDGAGQVAKELSSLADGFSRTSTPEETMRRGKEYASQAAERARESLAQAASGDYAQQAREKASGFASTARDTFSAVGTSATSAWQGSKGSSGGTAGKGSRDSSSERNSSGGPDSSGGTHGASGWTAGFPSSGKGGGHSPKGATRDSSGWGAAPSGPGGAGNWPAPGSSISPWPGSGQSGGYNNAGGFGGSAQANPFAPASSGTKPSRDGPPSPGPGSRGSPWGPQSGAQGPGSFGGFGGGFAGGGGASQQGSSPWGTPPPSQSGSGRW